MKESKIREILVSYQKKRDKELKNDIKVLEVYFNKGNKTLALAAIQLGIPKRIIYLKNTYAKT